MQQFDKILSCNASNDQKRKLCKSAEICFENFVNEITSSELIFGGFQPFRTTVLHATALHRTQLSKSFKTT